MYILGFANQNVREEWEITHDELVLITKFRETTKFGLLLHLYRKFLCEIHCVTG